MGNHLIERNRIHHNSIGIFTESSWDLGSTIRYNLIYENHHPDDAFANRVLNLTGDGLYHPGGAFMFKDIQLSPFSIYNNTFWHNFLIFSGHWQAGYQHLVFNNIFGAPHKYWESVTGFATDFMELTRSLTDRICHSVFAAQSEAPSASSVTIMSTPKGLSVTDTPVAGALINGFPASAENRWLEMDSSEFLSLDPASESFLEPDWADSNVQNFIQQKGWQESGVKNSNGTRADLGAIEQAHGMPAFVGTINPVPSPVLLNGTTAKISFALDERIGTMADPAIRLLRLVKTKHASGSFGSGVDSLIITADDMSVLTIPATPAVQTGPNEFTITCPAVSGYAFIEMIVEAAGADGKRFTLATGFLPYRNLSYKLVVEFHDKNGSNPVLTEVTVGDTVQLRLLPQKVDGTIFWSPLTKVSVQLSSGFDLLVPGDPSTPLGYPGGLAGGPDSKLVIFTGVPKSGIDYIAAGAEWKESAESTPMPFIGGTSIKVLERPTTADFAGRPPSLQPGSFPCDEVTVTCFDLRGRTVFRKTVFTDKGIAPSAVQLEKLASGRAPQIFLLDITFKDAVSHERTRSIRKMVMRHY